MVARPTIGGWFDTVGGEDEVDGDIKGNCSIPSSDTYYMQIAFVDLYLCCVFRSKSARMF